MPRLGKEMVQLFDTHGHYRATVMAPPVKILCLDGVYYVAGENTAYQEGVVHDVTDIVDHPHRKSDAPVTLGVSDEH